MKNAVIGYATAIALTTGAAVIGQNQPAGTPTRPPAGTQPDTARPGSAQPGSIRPGESSDQQARWRDTADQFARMNERMESRNEELARKLAQAQVQTGDARVNAIAEVLTGVLEEQERTNRAIVRLQRLAIRGYLDDSGKAGEYDSWKQQYPFLDDSQDMNDMDRDGSDPMNPRKDMDRTNPTDPRSPR